MESNTHSEILGQVPPDGTLQRLHSAIGVEETVPAVVVSGRQVAQDETDPDDQVVSVKVLVEERK